MYDLVVYAILGIYYLTRFIPNWYAALTGYLLFKWIFNYRKCTISYIECKIRNVHKTQGILYNYLEHLVDYRYLKNICIIYIFQFIILVKFVRDKYY